MKDALTYAHDAGFFSFNVIGWKAEFERLIEAVRADAIADHIRDATKMVQEPVAWIYEDELPEDYPYGEMFSLSRVIDGVRMFPKNSAAPQQECGAPCARHCESNAYEIEIRRLKNCLFQAQEAAKELAKREVASQPHRYAGSFGD